MYVATIKLSAESLLVDLPNVTIPCTKPVPAVASCSFRSTRSFSDMSSGKFRRMFNRHAVAFRR